jgi:hypothetical protein
MPISREVLNTTFSNFRGPLVRTFSQNTPLRKMLIAKAKVSSDSGSFVERGIMTGSPARGRGMYNGDETLDRTRRKKTEKYRVDFHRVVISINIPQKELNENKGKTGVLKLINEYPKAVVDSYAIDREKYLLTGKSAGMAIDSEELYGFLTLNGQFVDGIGTGVENGLLDFAAKDAQTDNVQNVDKSEAIWHYNQYGDIGSWATDGMKVLRRVYRAAAQFAGSEEGGVDLMFMDDETYGNYQESKAELIRTKKITDNVDQGNTLKDVFALAGVYPSQQIDLANDFTGDAADGVIFGINTEFVEIVQLEKPDVSQFVDAGPDQDGVTAKLCEHEAMIFQKFPAHFAISGGSR